MLKKEKKLEHVHFRVIKKEEHDLAFNDRNRIEIEIE